MVLFNEKLMINKKNRFFIKNNFMTLASVVKLICQLAITTYLVIEYIDNYKITESMVPFHHKDLKLNLTIMISFPKAYSSKLRIATGYNAYKFLDKEFTDCFDYEINTLFNSTSYNQSLTYKCRRITNLVNSRTPNIILLTCSNFNKFNRTAEEYNLTDSTCTDSLTTEQLNSINGYYGFITEEYDEESDKMYSNSTLFEWKNYDDIGGNLAAVINYKNYFVIS